MPSLWWNNKRKTWVSVFKDIRLPCRESLWLPAISTYSDDTSKYVRPTSSHNITDKYTVPSSF